SAPMEYRSPRTVIPVTARVSLPGELLSRDGAMSVTVSSMVDPAGTTTAPLAFFTSEETVVVTLSPTLLVRDEMVLLRVELITVPDASVAFRAGVGEAGAGRAGAGAGLGAARPPPLAAGRSFSA